MSGETVWLQTGSTATQSQTFPTCEKLPRITAQFCGIPALNRYHGEPFTENDLGKLPSFLCRLFARYRSVLWPNKVLSKQMHLIEIAG